MRYRTLGRTGLAVSELCLGAMTFGGKGFWKVVGQQGVPEVEQLLGTALDAGINFVDTANVYSEGESERVLGAALKALGRPRDQVVIATKVRGRMGPGPNQVGLSRAHILQSMDDSLRRLGLDHVDLLQIHGLDPVTPVDETLRAFEDLTRQGKTRYTGFSNWPAWLAMKALGIQDRMGWQRFASAQLYYSIAGRDIERELVPMAQSEGLAILPWSPLAGGLLSGKFDLEAGGSGPAGARRTDFDFPPVDRPRGAACVRELRKIAEAHGATVPRVALAWMLNKPHVTSIILGAKSVDQLNDNLGAASLVLAPEEHAALDAVSALPSEYPGWMLGWQNRESRL